MTTNSKKCKFSNWISVRPTPLQFKLVEVVVAHWTLLRGFDPQSKPAEQRQRNIEIRNMPPRKRPGPKEPLYTISWPPLKLQFQFDHTRRVVGARSRIDAIQTGPVENYSLRGYVGNLPGRERARSPG
jgi:hypothetical protein